MPLFGLRNRLRNAGAKRAVLASGGTVDTENYGAKGGHDLTVRDYAQGVPNIRLSEAVKSFGRQLKWLIPLLLIGMIVAWFATNKFKRTYTAHGSLMVQLGDEYVYQPIGSQAAQNGLQLTPDTIILTEVGIIKNSEVIDAVIGQMTSTPSDSMRFDKTAEESIRAAGNNQAAIREAQMERRKRVESSFVVMPQPKSSIINLAYKHSDPAVAVEALNAFIDEYKVFRRSVFVEGSSDLIGQRRVATEEQLTENEKMIAQFLKRNNISDFASEQEGVQKRTEELKEMLNKTRAEIAETEAALAKVEDQLRSTPAMIDLYRDDRASQRIAQAELELGQLLAKYLPNSDPVRQKREELEQLRSVQSGYNGQATGGRRVGPNPVHQDIMKSRNTLQASADSLREKEFTLQRQLNSADGKVRQLTQLTPQYQNLVRERKTLSERLATYNAREQEALINQAQAAANNENVREISRARYALKGQNTRMLMFALATLFWGFALLMVALARVFLDPRLFVSARISPPASGQTVGGGAYIPEAVAEPRFAPTEYQPAAHYQPVQYQQDYAAPHQEPYYAQQAAGGGQAQPYAAPSQADTSSGPLSGPVEWTPQVQNGPYVAPQGSSAALDPYANPYDAPYSGQNPQLQGQTSSDMNVLGTLPPNSNPQS
ncbi:uncharacterized protein involved in exopolysaccharide biosynthesis [Litorimonas taeanensis]|uniref:Uncharacterized protein involved in exopolysaccharide biosynthesis n=2 Tax=Litorimonas taeanensis TaxID=568099 RepID=A0A420WLK3_9PROT|nr:uncharacterized protein involved in exopolysaccharide biosynthesis [Litorimonas taeanensis]